MGKSKKEAPRRICQNCKNYRRPVCYVEQDKNKFTARKNTCEWFKPKK